jgi:hypothetical protein
MARYKLFMSQIVRSGCPLTPETRDILKRVESALEKMFCNGEGCLYYHGYRKITVARKDDWMLISFDMDASGPPEEHMITLDVHVATDGKKLVVTESNYFNTAYFSEKKAIDDIGNQLDQGHYAEI